MVGRHSDAAYRDILEGIKIKTLVHGERTLMAEFRLAAGRVLPQHAHPFEQTGYLVSGRLELVIDGTTHTVGPGDSWCIPMNSVHGATVDEDSVALEVFSPAREDYLKYLDGGSVA